MLKTSNLQKYVIGMDHTIKEAIATISLNLTRCAIVTRQPNIVVGVLSEGDIVRYLMDDVSLYTPVGKLVKPSFKYLNKIDMTLAIELLRTTGVTLIPVVDKSFALESVITIHDILVNLFDSTDSTS